ncbi:phage tail protein [Hymenobacter baengnokdamensis]|uniref:phage tail protein n=1 Tax=Hymenobacter baengnokdamensis TaxID=2615203 RepID=UPI001248EB71|nr:tail fiber protein [Hymenobacter baengnokdamensis]
MSTPYLGEIRAVGFTFAPVGWVACNGQTLSISQYDALYALLGTTYGGDGQTTFNVPDMRSRLGIGAQGGAAGPGLSAYQLGQQVGVENVTLTTNQLPTHQHPFAAAPGGTATGTAADPKLNFPGNSTTNPYATSATAGKTLNAAALVATAQAAGGSQPHTNLQPVLALNYIICTEGNYPPQP